MQTQNFTKLIQIYLCQNIRGDSVLVKDDKEAKILKNAIRVVHKNLHDPKWQSKTKSMRANDKGEYRVWRVT